MSKIHSVQIFDYFPNQPGWRKDASNSYSLTSTYKPDDFGGYPYMVEGIKLFEHTARTNIMIRGKDGKFLSFRDPEICNDVRQAMYNIRPFPTI